MSRQGNLLASAQEGMRLAMQVERDACASCFQFPNDGGPIVLATFAFSTPGGDWSELQGSVKEQIVA
jgi:hypothetical protein